MELTTCSNCDQLRRQLADKDREIQLLISRIEDLSRNDPFTGVLTQRGLSEVLVSELQRAHRIGHPICYVTFDIDDFKAVNENHGYPIGDAVLKKFADTAAKSLRVLDRFGRIGGDQFGIVMPSTWLDQGLIALERMGKLLKKLDWQQVAPGLALTFSAGMTTNTPTDTHESIMARANDALRQAKSAGGNRIVQIEMPLPDEPA
jgi:diguanylate cyclase (GGDEF)-like protein